MQEQALDVALSPARDLSDLRRGDLLFWKGHVAIVRDRDTLIHGNAFHMAVAIEPIGEAIARIKAAGSALSSVRRFGVAAPGFGIGPP
jgi:cell wall-associated NlpC family hydrolase